MPQNKHIQEDFDANGSEQRDDRLKLKSLLQVTQAINNNFSRFQVLKIYENVLRNRPYLNRFVLYTLGGTEPIREFHYGLEEADLEKISTQNLSNLPGLIEDVKYIPPADSLFYNIIIPAHHKGKLLAFLLADADYDFSDEGELSENEKADIEFVQTLTNIVFVALENKVLAKENLNQEILKKEIELASELQAMLFPPDWKTKQGGIEIDAFHKTFTDVGGDYYDYFPISEHETVMCIADVSGKGVSAALLMSNFQATVRSLFRYEHDLGKLIPLLNEQVDSSAKGEKFITVFLAKYNKENRILSYINCGHNPPFLLNGRESHWLSEGVPGLGMLPVLKSMEAFTVKMEENATMICFTDGITECQNKDGKYFGHESLKEIVLNNKSLNPSELNREIMLKLNAFVHDKNKFQDDVALLTCCFHG